MRVASSHPKLPTPSHICIRAAGTGKSSIPFFLTCFFLLPEMDRSMPMARSPPIGQFSWVGLCATSHTLLFDRLAFAGPDAFHLQSNHHGTAVPKTKKENF